MLVAIDPAAAAERLARALPRVPSTDERAHMPEPSQARPPCTRNVWLSIQAPDAAGSWLSHLEQMAPVEQRPTASGQLSVRLPLVSLSHGLVLAGAAAEPVFEILAAHERTGGRPLTITPTRAEAEAQARALVAIIAGRNAVVTYVLRPTRRSFRKRPFAMREIFDVLLSLGFAWSDGDRFWWPRSGDGAIEVATTTAPGHFTPEAAADGAVVDDLVFTLYLPLAPAPLIAHAAMVTAVERAARRLGGRPMGTDDEAFDPSGDRRALEQIVHDLEAAGLPAGSVAACAVF